MLLTQSNVSSTLCFTTTFLTMQSFASFVFINIKDVTIQISLYNEIEGTMTHTFLYSIFYIYFYVVRLTVECYILIGLSILPPTPLW